MIMRLNVNVMKRVCC